MPPDQLDNAGSDTQPLERFSRTPNEWRSTILGETLPHLCWVTDQAMISSPANRPYLARFYGEVFPALPLPAEEHLKPALFNAMALSLQATGSPHLKEWLTARTNQRTLREYKYPFADEYVGIQAGLHAIRTIFRLGRRPFDDYRQLRDQAVLLMRAAEADMSKIAPRESHCQLLLEAMIRGIPVRRYALNMPLYQFGLGCRQNRLWRGYTANTSHIATLVATNKHVANEVLETYGFPVPAQRIVNSVDEALNAAREIGYPVVVKPSTTDHGLAVSTHINNESELTAAFRLAEPHGTTIVERHVDGHDYRLTVVGGRCVSVLRRDPAQVEGDGVSDIATLMSIANAARNRDKVLQNYPLPPADDPLVAETLRSQELTAQSVPELGRTVLLRSNANVSTGGSYRTVTNQTHPDNLVLAERIAACIGLDHAGIDLITPDIGTPWHNIACGVCEVNPTPGIVVAPHFDALLDHLVAAGNRGRIPIVALIGDGPEADAAFDSVAALAAARAILMGSVRRGVARIGSCLITSEQRSSNDNFDMLVADAKVEAILLHISPSELLENGLKAPYLDLVAYFAADAIIERVVQSPVSVASQARTSLSRPSAGAVAEAFRGIVAGPGRE